MLCIRAGMFYIRAWLSAMAETRSYQDCKRHFCTVVGMVKPLVDRKAQGPFSGPWALRPGTRLAASHCGRDAGRLRLYYKLYFCGYAGGWVWSVLLLLLSFFAPNGQVSEIISTLVTLKVLPLLLADPVAVGVALSYDPRTATS